MSGEALRSPRERPLFIAGVLLSALVWAALVASVIGISYAITIVVFLVIGRALLLARIRGDGVRLSAAQMPDLYGLCEEAARRVGLRDMPEVLVQQEGDVLHALALRFFGHGVIVLSSELVAKCKTPEQLMFVVGHEMGHLAEGHLKWRLFLAPYRVMPWIGPAYARACEYTCDRYGLAAAQDPLAAKRAILLHACGHVHAAVDPDAYAAQRHDTADFWAGVYEVVSEHPYATCRVAALDGARDPAAEKTARHPLGALLAPLAGIGAGTPASVALLVALYFGLSFALMGPMTAWTRALNPAPSPPAYEQQEAPLEAPAATPSVPAPGPALLQPRGPYTVASSAPRELEPGITLQEFTLQRAHGATRVWVYRPAGRGYPVVLVPPAGGRAISAAYLTENDRPEHLPWVRAGFMVVSHEFDGPNPDERADDLAWSNAARRFRAANGGIDDMRDALDVALARSPDADATRVAVAGHSSAGAQALVFAAGDGRVRLCAAFMPPADYFARTPQRVRDAFRPVVPDIDDFLRMESPVSHVASISVPVFLSAADDDTSVSAEEVAGLHGALTAGGARVEFLRVERGGHYDAMIREAVPAAIAWASREFHLPRARRR